MSEGEFKYCFGERNRGIVLREEDISKLIEKFGDKSRGRSDILVNGFALLEQIRAYENKGPKPSIERSETIQN